MDDTDLKVFLGASGFYWRLIEEYAYKAAPLTNLLENDSLDLEWSERRQPRDSAAATEAAVPHESSVPSTTGATVPLHKLERLRMRSTLQSLQPRARQSNRLADKRKGKQ
jgi:hypothetical protein